MRTKAIGDIAYFFPFCALAARYKDDSGDGDQDTTDFIDDTIGRWLPEAKVTKYKTKLDFALTVTSGTSAIVVIRGTEGIAWLDNFSPFPISNASAHDGFYSSGVELYNAIKDDLKWYADVTIVGQSRGGALAPVVAEQLYNDRKVKAFVITYSGPPVYTRKGKRRFDAIGIDGYRVINPRDIVDNAARPILKHVLKKVTLPYAGNILQRIPIIGWLIGGHAYTSIFDGLIARAERTHNAAEIEYLRDRKGYCSI